LFHDQDSAAAKQGWAVAVYAATVSRPAQLTALIVEYRF
jgi:hypothetical protein